MPREGTPFDGIEFFAPYLISPSTLAAELLQRAGVVLSTIQMGSAR